MRRVVSLYTFTSMICILGSLSFTGVLSPKSQDSSVVRNTIISTMI
jgi:hypothetical protein